MCLYIVLLLPYIIITSVGIMVFNATFNNIGYMDVGNQRIRRNTPTCRNFITQSCIEYTLP